MIYQFLNNIPVILLLASPHNSSHISCNLTKVCAHLGGSMERGHYVAFINVGPNLKVRVIFPIQVSGGFFLEKRGSLWRAV